MYSSVYIYLNFINKKLVGKKFFLMHQCCSSYWGWDKGKNKPSLHSHQPSVQFNSVAQLCLILCDLMDCSMPGFPVLHHLPEFSQTHIHWVVNAIQPSHPLSLPSQTISVLLPQEPHEQYEKGNKWAGIKTGGTDLGHLVSEEGKKEPHSKSSILWPRQGITQ